MRRPTARRSSPAAALALALALGGCFVGPAADPSGPALQLSTSALQFAVAVGGADPAPQTIVASDAGAGGLAAPSAAISYRDGSGWLTATVTGAAAPYAIAVRASAAGLASGTYAATLSVDSPGAADTPQTVAVSLTVGSTSRPTLALSTATLSFTSVGGATPPAQTVTVSNVGAGTLAAPVTSTAYLGQQQGWLVVTVSGSAAPFILTVQPRVTGLVPRASPNLATISVDCPGASNTPQSISVQLTVR